MKVQLDLKSILGRGNILDHEEFDDELPPTAVERSRGRMSPQSLILSAPRTGIKPIDSISTGKSFLDEFAPAGLIITHHVSPIDDNPVTTSNKRRLKNESPTAVSKSVTIKHNVPAKHLQFGSSGEAVTVLPSMKNPSLLNGANSVVYGERCIEFVNSHIYQPLNSRPFAYPKSSLTVQPPLQLQLQQDQVFPSLLDQLSAQSCYGATEASTYSTATSSQYIPGNALRPNPLMSDNDSNFGRSTNPLNSSSNNNKMKQQPKLQHLPLTTAIPVSSSAQSQGEPIEAMVGLRVNPKPIPTLKKIDLFPQKSIVDDIWKQHSQSQTQKDSNGYTGSTSPRNKYSLSPKPPGPKNHNTKLTDSGDVNDERQLKGVQGRTGSPSLSLVESNINKQSTIHDKTGHPVLQPAVCDINSNLNSPFSKVSMPKKGGSIKSSRPSPRQKGATYRVQAQLERALFIRNVYNSSPASILNSGSVVGSDNSVSTHQQQFEQMIASMSVAHERCNGNAMKISFDDEDEEEEKADLYNNFSDDDQPQYSPKQRGKSFGKGGSVQQSVPPQQQSYISKSLNLAPFGRSLHKKKMTSADNLDDDGLPELLLPEITVKSYASPIPYYYPSLPTRRILLQELEKKSNNWNNNNNRYQLSPSPFPQTDSPRNSNVHQSGLQNNQQGKDSTVVETTTTLIMDDESVPPFNDENPILGAQLDDDDFDFETPSLSESTSFARDPREHVQRKDHLRYPTTIVGVDESVGTDDFNPLDSHQSLGDEQSMNSSSVLLQEISDGKMVAVRLNENTSIVLPKEKDTQSVSSAGSQQQNAGKKKAAPDPRHITHLSHEAKLNKILSHGPSGSSALTGSLNGVEGSGISGKGMTVRDPVLKILSGNESVKKLSGAPIKPNVIDYEKTAERSTKGPLMLLSSTNSTNGGKSPVANHPKISPHIMVPSVKGTEMNDDWSMTLPKVNKISSIMPVSSSTITRLILRDAFEEDRRGVFGGDVGSVLGDRFEITSILGHGVFGIVFRCVDLQLNSSAEIISPSQESGSSSRRMSGSTQPGVVAIKVTHKHPLFQQQADREIEILRLLTSSSTSYFSEQDDKHVIRPLFFWSFPEGYRAIGFPCYEKNLFEYMRDNDFLPLNLHMVSRIAKQLVQALVHVHQQNVIHCDLKPENVLIYFPTPSLTHPHVIVIDFGSAVIVGEDPTVLKNLGVNDLHPEFYDHQTEETQKRRKKNMCKKVTNNHIEIQSQFYRAPEVIVGLDYDHMIDIWSLGCIVAELLTGTPLFVGEDNVDQLAVIAEALGPIPEEWQEIKSTPTLSRVFTPMDGAIRDNNMNNDIAENNYEIQRFGEFGSSDSSPPFITPTKVYDWVHSFGLPRNTDNSIVSFANQSTNRRSVVITSTRTLSCASDDFSGSSKIGGAHPSLRMLTNLTSNSFMATQSGSVRDYYNKNITTIIKSHQCSVFDMQEGESPTGNVLFDRDNCENNDNPDDHTAMVLDNAIDFVLQCLRYHPESRLSTILPFEVEYQDNNDRKMEHIPCTALSHPFILS